MKKYLKLKVFNLYGGAALTTDDENPFTCPVCLEQYDDKKRKPTTLLCGHSLCIACVTEIAQIAFAGPDPPKCPLCREDIDIRFLRYKKPSITLMKGSVYLKQKVNNLEKEKRELKYNLERELRAEKRLHHRTKEREKRLKKQLEPKVEKKSFVITKDYDTTIIKNDKKIAAVAAEEKPKLRYPEAETLKFKEEKRDMSKEYLWDREYKDNVYFNDILAIKKYINEDGLEEFQVGEYADKVIFDENGVEKREHILIENINLHGHLGKFGLPLYGIVYKTLDGRYTVHTGTANFEQLVIRNDNAELRKKAAESGAARIDPEVYKFIQKISPVESARRARAHKYANEKKTEMDSDEDDY